MASPRTKRSGNWGAVLWLAILAGWLALFMWLVPRPSWAGEHGIASWYSYGPTACGSKVGPMTAAHRSLPCGTHVRVTTQAGRSVVVRINDRGPFKRGRIIDVSPDAASALGIVHTGLAAVDLEVMR